MYIHQVGYLRSEAVLHINGKSTKGTTMANPDLKKINFPNSLLQWPKLDQTYRYNSAASKSEPCDQAANGAAWSCSFILSQEEAKEVFNICQKHYKECRERKTTMKPFKKVFGMKKLDDGTVQFTAKKNGTKQDGSKNTPPEIVGGNVKPLENRKIYSGSMGNPVVIAFPTTSPDGDGGISLILHRLQVTKAIYGPPEEDYKPVEMEVINRNSDGEEKPVEEEKFDPYAPDPNAKDQSSNDEFDDEIPF